MKKIKEERWAQSTVTYKGKIIPVESRQEGGVLYVRVEEPDGEWSAANATHAGSSSPIRLIALEMCRGLYGKE